jgi:FixJ family two-component response regulator
MRLYPVGKPREPPEDFKAAEAIRRSHMTRRVNAKAVFVVEDDDGMREAIEQLLCVAGFRTLAYSSAEAMLDEVAAESPLCVISDLSLPAMSGLDLISELARRREQPPVIIITAHESASTRQEAARLGARAYLAKPFSSTALLSAIDEIALRMT